LCAKLERDAANRKRCSRSRGHSRLVRDSTSSSSIITHRGGYGRPSRRRSFSSCSSGITRCGAAKNSAISPESPDREEALADTMLAFIGTSTTKISQGLNILQPIADNGRIWHVRACQKLGAALSALGQAFSKTLKQDPKNETNKTINAALGDAGHILTDLHYNLSTTRRSFSLPYYQRVLRQKGLSIRFCLVNYSPTE
ncbi:unnamed protein product, partial [Ceratitis capitata]